MSVDEVMQYVLAKKRKQEKKAGVTYTDEQAFRNFLQQIKGVNEQLEDEGLQTLGLDNYYRENEAGGGNQDQLQMFYRAKKQKLQIKETRMYIRSLRFKKVPMESVVELKDKLS